MSPVAAIDFISFLAVIVALIVLGRGWKRDLPYDIKWLIVGLLGLDLFHHFSNILEWGEISKALDPFEDFVEILIPILWFMLIYSYLKELTTDDLRKSERRLKESQEIAQMGQWELDLTTNKLYWSDGLYDLFDININEFGASYEAFLDIVHPDDREFVDKAYTDSKKKKTPYNIVHRLLLKDGTVKYVNEICRTEYDKDGHPLSSTGTVQDITLLKQAEFKLAESQEKYRSLVENLTDGVFIINLDGKFEYLNLEFEKITGYHSQDFIGHPFTEIIAPEYIELTVDRFRRGLSGETIPIYEIELLHKDRKTVPVELKIASLFDDDGKIIGRIGLARDISDRKQAEESLRKSEEKYRQLAEECPISIMTFDDEGKVTFVNNWHLNTFARLKYDADFFVGKKITELPGIIKAGVAAKLEKVLEGKHVFLEDVYFPEFTGEHTGYQSIKAVPVYKEGVLVSGILIREDLTKRKQAEEALRESEEKYRSMMEAMNDPVSICSSAYKIEYMNPAMIKRTGRDATGEFCFKALHDLEEKCPWCQHHKTQTGDHFMTEIVSPKDNRSYIVSHSPIFNGDGAISKMTIYRDTTDLNKMEAQLQKAHKMEAIGTLAGGIAHDFNNILFPMFGYLEMMLEDVSEDDPLRSHLEEVFVGAKRARDLVQQILTFSRQKDHQMKPLKVHLVIKEALKLLNSSLPSTIEISQNIKTGCGLVMADPIRIHQIIMNLCTNAYHAMEERGGKLTVNLKEVELAAEELKDPTMIPGPHVSLTVADTGPGMEQSIIDRIFDPYFTTKEEGKGTGLGLAVVHGIVKSQGGHISVYSEPGKGAEFKVYLPVIKKQKETSKVEIDTPIQKGDEQILLVDDEDIIVRIEKQMLERLGYHVTVRTSSIDALEAFRMQSDKFDLVITDLTMPNMTGDKLAGELIKIRSEIPVILCTGFSEMMSKEKAESMGIKGFLMKPVVLKDLSNMIRKVLDKK